MRTARNLEDEERRSGLRKWGAECETVAIELILRAIHFICYSPPPNPALARTRSLNFAQEHVLREDPSAEASLTASDSPPPTTRLQLFLGLFEDPCLSGFKLGRANNYP
ncbi:hypothetical protein MRX96_011130 [Rhipicephalus microplus]